MFIFGALYRIHLRGLWFALFTIAHVHRTYITSLAICIAFTRTHEQKRIVTLRQKIATSKNASRQFNDDLIARTNFQRKANSIEFMTTGLNAVYCRSDSLQ